MKKVFLTLGLLFFVNSICVAQETGNRIYGNQGYYQGNKAPTTSSGNLSDKDDKSRYSIEASVLLNLKADAYVVVFAVKDEALTANQSNQIVDNKISNFTSSLSGLGVTKDDIFVDFITQNRIYDFRVRKNKATEVAAGYETKKNVAIRYKQRDLFRQIVANAAKEGISDLIKVDYIVSDFSAVKERLFQEAAKLIVRKKEKYTELFGVTLKPVGLSRETFGAYYPSERYQSYRAFETGNATVNRRKGVKVQQRKSSTFYYEPIGVEKFDQVINPIGIEPVVQFTLYLRMNYDNGIPPEKIEKEKLTK
ncbi:MAG: SIMPL domain-containing protein [Pyrinomonadaceae bacterium]|nr:SIMPL domain-containing protein [Pyrinomonadaceae bacterium]